MFGFLKKSTTMTISQLAGWIGWGSAAGVEVSQQSALYVSSLFCGARVIAEGIAQMPPRVVRKDFDEKRQVEIAKIQPNHWAHRLFTRAPNEWQTPFEFIEGMVLCAAVAGGAIAIKNVVNGQVRELLPVPMGSWSVEQLADWSLRVRVDYSDKTHGYFDLKQVFYLRGPSTDGYQGMSVIRHAREALGLSIALERQQAKLAGSGGKPSGVLSFDNGLGPEARANLRKTWAERFGPNGDGGIAILDGDTKYHQMTMTSVDAQFLETRRFVIEEIARFLRVQPIMMMQSDKASTYASAEQMFRVHVIHSLAPWVLRFEQAVQRDILGVDSEFSLDLDEYNLMRGDFADEAEYFGKMIGNGGGKGVMTQNEIRARIGLPPSDSEGADNLAMGAMEQGKEVVSDGAV